MHQPLCTSWFHQQSAGWISLPTSSRGLSAEHKRFDWGENGEAQRELVCGRGSLWWSKNQGDWLRIMSSFDTISSAILSLDSRGFMKEGQLQTLLWMWRILHPAGSVCFLKEMLLLGPSPIHRWSGFFFSGLQSYALLQVPGDGCSLYTQGGRTHPGSLSLKPSANKVG